MDYNDINGKPVDINKKLSEHMKKIKGVNGGKSLKCNTELCRQDKYFDNKRQ